METKKRWRGACARRSSFLVKPEKVHPIKLGVLFHIWSRDRGLRKLHDTAPTGMSCHELRIAGMATVPGEARASSLLDVIEIFSH